MFSLSAVVITLLLIPTFLCLLVLRSFFPKHTIKLHEVQLIPFGLGITLLTNLCTLFYFAELLTPPCCFTDANYLSHFISNIIVRRNELIGAYFIFITVPVVVFLLLVWAFYANWKSYILMSSKKAPEQKPKLLNLRKKCAAIVDDFLVNYMGRMTAHSQLEEALFVDVLDENDSLYSGIYIDYFIEDKKLVGLQLSNVLRHSFKSETERKDAQKNGTSDQPSSGEISVKSSSRYPDPYLLPSGGSMFFPVERIQNFFWKLKKNHTEEIPLQSGHKQVRFAWLLGISYALSHLDFKITGVITKGEFPEINPLIKSFQTLGLGVEHLAKHVEIREKPPQ